MENIEKSFDEPTNLVNILIASQAIVFMATRLSEINEQMKYIPHKSEVIKNSVAAKDKMLHAVFIELREIAENLGNYIDSNDALDRIDEVYTQPAFDIMYGRVEEK